MIRKIQVIIPTERPWSRQFKYKDSARQITEYIFNKAWA